MGTISSSIGLISGIDYGTMVDQLMAIEARPRDKLTLRMSSLDAQKTALADISARLSALLARITSLTKPSFFSTSKAISSNPAVLSASTTGTAVPGSFSFTVRSLARTQQLISRGYTSRNAAVAAGSLTIESAAAQVNRDTALEELNGYAGVQRGSFKITNARGESATINLREAQTVSDVLDLINTANIGVRAELRGEGIHLADTTGGTGGLRISEVGEGHVAADLGFTAGLTFSADGQLTGGNLIYLSEATPLSALNDGLGLRRAVAGTDFQIQVDGLDAPVKVKLSEVLTADTRLERLNHARGVELGTIRITNRAGVSEEIDLSDARTIGDVQTAIQNAISGITVVISGSGLMITDGSNEEDHDLTIEDVSGHAARDLGIAGTTDGKSIRGSQILNVDTLGDVLAAINYADGNETPQGLPAVRAAIDASGRGITLTSEMGAALTLVVPEESSSQALFDLGFQPNSTGESISGGRIIGGLNTVLLKTLNGGRGLAGGIMQITANGNTVQVDVTGAETLRDVIEAINTASEQSGLGIAASYHSSGNKLQIVNTADGAGSITISDVQGELAHSLGIDAGGSRITSNNLQRRYVSENTRLQDLNMGQGVSLGKIKITDSRGVSATIDLASERAETLQDVIDAIRGATALQLEVRINDTGDGLLITDTSDGTGKLIIEDDTGTAARDLNIAGESEGAAKQIDGSFELKIDTATADTLDQVLAQINKTRLANAAIINDGSGVAPYRLSITSAASGRAGELIIDAGTTGLDLTTLTQAQDAAITLGSDDNGLLIRSTTNTITDAIPGVTLTLTGTDDQPVTVTVERDLDSMLSTLKGLVDDYNGLLDRIKQYASYDSETQTKGILFGESTLDAVKQRLNRALTGTISGAGGRFSRLSQLGVKVESGGRLSFDEQKFREAYAADSNGVTQLFTAAKAGVAVKVKAELDQLTGTGGLLDRRSKMYTEQKEALGKRVDDLNELLELKRQKLLRSFQRMEDALAQMQSQQTSISSLGSLISSFSTTKN